LEAYRLAEEENGGGSGVYFGAKMVKDKTRQDISVYSSSTTPT